MCNFLSARRANEIKVSKILYHFGDLTDINSPSLLISSPVRLRSAVITVFVTTFVLASGVPRSRALLNQPFKNACPTSAIWMDVEQT